MNYDLHVHTNDSDGVHSRIYLLKKAHELKMEYISFTDHDYISNIDLSEEYKNKYGNCSVGIINGVEFTINDYKSMHILGYDIRKSKKLEEKLEEIDKQNVELCKNLISKLNNYYGMNLSVEEYREFKLTKGLIRRMIIDKGYAKNFIEAGNMYTGPNSKFYEKNVSLNLETVINLVKEGNGILVLAHPSTLKLENELLDKLICNLSEMGIDGIEVFNSSKTTLEQKKYYMDLAIKYNMLMSCGSDYHEDKHVLGIRNNISNKLINLIKER